MVRFWLGTMLVFAAGAAAQTGGYSGSAACARCHPALYARWKKTRMANVVRDPREHPEAVLPDFSKADPLLTFSLKDVAFVYGSKWKQRYFQKIGNDYYPLPAQWDVTHQVWRAYNVKAGTDWWVAHYGPDNKQRPTGPLCDGCHSVNYNLATGEVGEWNVGCEKCHGPGQAHVQRPSRANIVNPARLDSFAANDVCIQCHSQGQPLKKPLDGKYVDWPAGYVPGLKLHDFWRLEDHKQGETTFTHFADGTGHKNRMQGNDFVQSLMYRRGVECSSCHDVHGTENNADLIKPASTMCLECHGPRSPNGPFAATLNSTRSTRPAVRGANALRATCRRSKLRFPTSTYGVTRSRSFRRRGRSNLECRTRAMRVTRTRRRSGPAGSWRSGRRTQRGGQAKP